MLVYSHVLCSLTSSDADTALSQPSFTLFPQNSHFLLENQFETHLATSQLISPCDSLVICTSPSFIALVNEQSETKRDRSHLCCLMEEKKDKDAKDFRLKPRPSAPRWRHPKVQVWASWSLLQLVFWWLPLRYWTGSLAGRGSRGGSRSPMEAGNQQTTLGKVAHNCFGHFFGPPQFSALSEKKIQQIQKYEIVLFL